MPSMNNEVFERSVIYLTEHCNVSGAVGVIINKNIPNQNESLIELGFSKYDNAWGKIPLHFGGPVELGSGFVLHQGVKSDGLILTGNRNEIDLLAKNELVKPFMLTAGYCVWEGFQLERELRMNSWLVLDGVAEYLLADVPANERYREALKLSGINNLAAFDFSRCGNA